MVYVRNIRQSTRLNEFSSYYNLYVYVLCNLRTILFLSNKCKSIMFNFYLYGEMLSLMIFNEFKSVLFRLEYLVKTKNH